MDGRHRDLASREDRVQIGELTGFLFVVYYVTDDSWPESDDGG